MSFMSTMFANVKASCGSRGSERKRWPDVMKCVAGFRKWKSEALKNGRVRAMEHVRAMEVFD
jgi:hypothetical protein